MKGKKIVSTLLALLLLASLPVSAHAATWDIGKGDITVNAGSGGQTVTQGGGAAIPDSAPVITGTSKENNVTINADSGQTASVTFSGVNIDVRDKGKAAVSTTGEGNVSIELNGGSTLRSGYEHAGLEKNNGGVLTVTVDEDLAILTGRLSGIRTLKAQGVEKIVFVTKGATSAFLLSDLLDKGEGGEAYRLTHNGKAVTFTLGESMADVSAILIKP